MIRNRPTGFTAFAFWGSICAIMLFMSSFRALCDTYDDDTLLEFHWDAASGNVDHYNVYISVDEGGYFHVGSTPGAEAPIQTYAIDTTLYDGMKYRIKVEAENVSGVTGPMSEPSDVVWRIYRSPGDENGQKPGDADENSRVSVGDWAILCKSWGTQPGDSLFDYRADFNYDHVVDDLDIDVMESTWGNIYGDGGIASASLSRQNMPRIYRYPGRGATSGRRQIIERRR